MKQFQYTITDANGIHARPAGLLVKEAQRFASAVKLIRGEKSADPATNSDDGCRKAAIAT